MVSAPHVDRLYSCCLLIKRTHARSTTSTSFIAPTQINWLRRLLIHVNRMPFANKLTSCCRLRSASAMPHTAARIDGQTKSPETSAHPYFHFALFLLGQIFLFVCIFELISDVMWCVEKGKDQLTTFCWLCITMRERGCESERWRAGKVRVNSF